MRFKDGDKRPVVAWVCLDDRFIIADRKFVYGFNRDDAWECLDALVEFGPDPVVAACTCLSLDLFRYGCTCGHLTKEQGK
jgi:hypothetical protein